MAVDHRYVIFWPPALLKPLPNTTVKPVWVAERPTAKRTRDGPSDGKVRETPAMYEVVATSILDKAVSTHAAFDQLLKTNAASGIVTPPRLQSWHLGEFRATENASKS